MMCTCCQVKDTHEHAFCRCAAVVRSGPDGPQQSLSVRLRAALQVAALGLVRGGQFVVCVQQEHEEFCLKIMAVDPRGGGIDKRDSALVGGSALVLLTALLTAPLPVLPASRQ